MLSTLLTLLVILVVLLLFLVALMIFRATMFGRVPEQAEPLAWEEAAAVEGPVLAEHLAAVLRLQTVSEEDRAQVNVKAFERLHKILERTYPRLHATLRREWINDYSLLYTWPGRSPDLEGVVLLAHQDVVPANPLEWAHPPFDGMIADDFVWGRGALDMKSTLVALLEAVESLIKTGYQPERTVYLAFGHDEEVGGTQGGRAIVEALQQRGARLWAALDEGGMITEGILPGMALPAALVGITEKGHASVELKVEAQPGHSSTPPPHTAIGVLARAVARVENNPMPARMSMARLMFAELGAFLPFSLRLALANTWLLGGTVRRRLAADSSTNAMIRTTMAVTRVEGGTRENVLPSSARALVNCRLLPGDSTTQAAEYIRKVVADDAVEVSLNADYSWEAAPVSQVDAPAYQSLTAVIRQIFPEAVVSPYLVVGATDSRYYAPICPNIYRFSPYTLDRALLKTLHGYDERLQVEALVRMVQFYHQLIKTWTNK